MKGCSISLGKVLTQYYGNFIHHFGECRFIHWVLSRAGFTAGEEKEPHLPELQAGATKLDEQGET